MKKFIISVLIVVCLLSMCINAQDEEFTRGSFCAKMVEVLGLDSEISGNIKFSDLNETHEYYEQIMIVSELGYIRGTDDNTFRPENKLTRAEVAKVLISMLFGEDFYVPVDATLPFDVDSIHWAKDYILKAVTSSLLKTENNLFKPTTYAKVNDINYEVVDVVLFLREEEEADENVVASGIYSGKQIKIDMDSSKLYVNGNEVYLDVKPLIIDSQLMTSARAISESLAASVEWDGSTSTIIYTLEDITVCLTVNVPKISINGVEKDIPVPAQIINGRTFCPFIEIAKAFGCTMNKIENSYLFETDVCKYKFYNDGTLKIYGIGDMEERTRIPWSSYASDIKSVVISEGITLIGESAFEDCQYLTNVTIPDSVTSIGDGAFEGCSSIRAVFVSSLEKWLSIEMKSSPKQSRSTKLFVDGNELPENVIIPLSITKIRDNAFMNCNNIKSVEIHGGVTSIDDLAFGYCDSLTSINIPDSVTCIGNYAFLGCSSLTSITIPGGVTSISDYAFEYCDSLKSIIIPDSVTSIGDSAFSRCSSLTSIEIHDSVTSIGDSAFYRCSSLTSITIPDSVTSIGDSAFAVCSSLTSIEIPDSVSSIDGSAFCYCESLTKIVIPEGVTSIGLNSFYGCYSLRTLELPSSIERIEADAFGGCLSLTNVIYTGTAQDWYSIAIDTSNTKLLNANITYVPKYTYFTQKIYKQNADDNEYTLFDTDIVKANAGEMAILPQTNIDGFVENESIGNRSGIVKEDNSLVIERYFDRKKYTISFESNGGMKQNEITAKHGAKVELPIIFRYGYIFDGWYTDSEFTTKATFAKMPTTDLTLYAKWIKTGTDIFGDINNDGHVDVNDLIFLAQYLATMNN